ncbi:MAG: DUF2202 domain-containing protein [Epsilonproteobacteria bacterium]|nr:DUF2202 domain-containing protein [Campylobacterota bacterium]
MLKQTIIISTVVALLSVIGSARGMNGNSNAGVGNKGGKSVSMNRGQAQNSQLNGDVTAIVDIPLSDLSDVQKEGLLFMIEEEKVARDVYAYLYEMWGTRVFRNIARSEQKHMDAIQSLLDRYSLESPTTLDTVGSFEDEELQALYDTLIAKGSSSLVDALEVGVLVEETDIADLEEILEAEVPADLEMVYENLLKGSYKHLNAFTRQLARQ